VTTLLWLLVHVRVGYGAVDAAARLPGRKFGAWCHEFTLSETAKVVASCIARTIACAAMAEYVTGGAGPGYAELYTKLRLSWLPPLAHHLLFRLVSPAAVQRLRRAVAEWGVDKEVTPRRLCFLLPNVHLSLRTKFKTVGIY